LLPDELELLEDELLEFEEELDELLEEELLAVISVAPQPVKARLPMSRLHIAGHFEAIDPRDFNRCRKIDNRQ
jgi:hypothetical protein